MNIFEHNILAEMHSILCIILRRTIRCCWSQCTTAFYEIDSDLCSHSELQNILGKHFWFRDSEVDCDTNILLHAFLTKLPYKTSEHS